MNFKRLALSNESAYEIVSEMVERTIDELQGVDVYIGTHPDRGSIIVVIPCMGDSLLLLPSATHAIIA